MDYIVQFRVMNSHQYPLFKPATKARLKHCNLENLYEVEIKEIFLNGVK